MDLESVMEVSKSMPIGIMPTSTVADFVSILKLATQWTPSFPIYHCFMRVANTAGTMKISNIFIKR